MIVVVVGVVVVLVLAVILLGGGRLRRGVGPGRSLHADRDRCPVCEGVGAVRGFGQLRPCPECDGTGMRITT